jgi:hypothetical protein
MTCLQSEHPAAFSSMSSTSSVKSVVLCFVRFGRDRIKSRRPGQRSSPPLAGANPKAGSSTGYSMPPDETANGYIGEQGGGGRGRDARADTPKPLLQVAAQ